MAAAAIHSSPVVSAERSIAAHHTRDLLLQAIQQSQPLAIAQGSKCPPRLLPLLTSEGFQQLCESVARPRFEQLTKAFIGQGPLQCGLTSLSIALNTCSKYTRFTANQLQEELRALINPACAFGRYFPSTIDEIATLGRQYHPGITVRYADESGLKQFRDEALRTMTAGGVVIANFDRARVGYASHFAGHMSPLAAYHTESDSFLVYDVAVKTWQSVWVPAQLLFQGMDTMDKPRDASCVAGSRGYMLIDRAIEPTR